MKCSAGVAVIAVIVLLGSALTMFGAIGMAFVYNSMDFATSVSPTEPMPPGLTPASMRYFGFLLCTVFLALGGVGAATGVGLLQLWRWARYSIITFGAVLALFGLASGLIMLLIPLPVPENNASLLLGMRIGFTLFYGLWVALGVFFAVFFTRKRIADQFQTAGVPAAPPLRPISITVIGWFMIIGSLSFPILFVSKYPAVLFGFILNGRAATTVYVCYAIIYILLGVGLLRYKPAALWGSICFFVAAALNILVLFLPGPKARYMEFIRSFSATAQPHTFLDPNSFFVFAMGIGGFSIAVPLYFLLTRRERFFQAAALVNSSTPAPPSLPATPA